MQPVINQLWEIVIKNPLSEKILIFPSFSAGRQLLESATRHGLTILNLRTETLRNLAEQVCKKSLLNSGCSIVPDILAMEFTIQVLERLRQADRLTYFNSLEITPSVCSIITHSIIDLKMTGIDVNDITTEMFVNPYKCEDIKTIWAEYDKELHIRKYIDQADLFQLAAGEVTPSQCIYIVPSNLKMRPLERNFLEALTKNNFQVISFSRPKGIIPLQTSLENEISPLSIELNEPYSSLLYLNDLANAPVTELPIQMFHAYGESNEIREVLRRIKLEKIPFDQTAIFYTTQNPYSHLLFDLAQRFDQLPVTFGRGIDICATNPGRLYFGLLSWAERGFKVSDIIPLISNGILKIPEKKSPPKSTITRYLRTSGIGWGKERYLETIDNQIINIRNQITDVAFEHDNDSSKTKLENFLWLKQFFAQLFTSLPDPDSEGRISYAQKARWLSILVDHYSSVVCQADHEAKKVICRNLKIIEDSVAIHLNRDDIFRRLEFLIRGVRVSASSPKPGHLHIDHYNSGLWISRQNVFIVGLDANRFPGTMREDPILLDIERESIGHCLPLLSNMPKEKVYDMVQFLSSVQGTLTVSYSAFDTLENRAVFPSSILLQMYRLKAHDETLDYSELIETLGNRKGFTPSDIDESLDDQEWWLSVLSMGNKKPDLDTFKTLYPTLLDGLKAESKRQLAEELTPFDGKVNFDPSLVDPTVGKDLVMSCSQLEMLGRCPFSYFLKYVLKIRPIEELVFDQGVWLNAKTKGDLYHGIFERFYKKLVNKGEPLNAARHAQFLYEIADELMSQKKVSVPPPSELVYDYERKSILDSCRIFLKSEEIESCDDAPKYFELTFGMHPGETNNNENFEAVTIELPNDKRFLLRGKIDRVDESENGLKIWDYKTGSTFGYSDKEYFKGGRQLQHGLYALALERLFSEKELHTNPKVILSGYIFPTQKGEGKRVVRLQVRRDSLYEILNHLFTLLSEGTFVMTDDENDCHYCDYRDACNRHSRSQKGLDKMMTDIFRGLRNYA
ncbi:PD-(D/E)XK nuclease family protein [Desulfosporosinus sp.]|uniref:PD-(D/E)XK nuclease family protein n=1 Tax=Desulfosporosinus sp. TaxID=157907 RepID=UPI0025BD6951|nr:PD-(D/E)XK nuclease family protein [Desulfosporosinus sp.]MBC2727387.1 PD-(D/E)XK nuclease family protein [Desulfosporosinus sp.]